MLLLAGLTAATACSRGAPALEVEKSPARLLVGIVATCASAVRDVQIRRPGQATAERAAPGAVLVLGDEVRTAPRSTARLALLGGGGLDVEESTAVVVDFEPSNLLAGRGGARTQAGRAAAGEPRIAVKEGVVRGVISPSSAGATPAGLVVLSSDGSVVRVAPRPGSEPVAYRLARREGGTELAILRGAASVKGVKRGAFLDAGRAAIVRDGELVETGAFPAAPQGLEPATDARFHGTPGLAVRLHWADVRGATGYRIQIARDPAFRDLVAAEVVQTSDYVFVPPAPGVHAWRVASRDATGRFGEYGPLRRLHCEEQPPRDLLTGPADGAVVRPGEQGSNLTFSWEPAGEGRTYRIVLARGPDLLADPVSTVVVSGQRAILEARPGEYWWGVFAESDGDPHPLFTRPRRLTVAKAPAEPRPSKVEVPREISLWGN